MTTDYASYLEAHRAEHLEQLKALLRYPSISTDPAHRTDVLQCAEFLAAHLREIGLEHVELLPTGGHPVVYADWLHAAGAPTVIVYGHYDVQPVDPLHFWTTPPFEPDIRDGRLYARGASDDKGPTFMHLKAFEALLQTEGALPVNVKLCIEGEEEIGSAHLPAFLERNQDRFRGDLLVISDTTMYGPGQPSVCYGLRGLAALQVDLRTVNRDLHSGIYGGAAPNAIHALTELLASMHDKAGRVLVEGFYDDVQPLTDEERRAYQQLDLKETDYAKALGLNGADDLVGEPEFSVLERVWARPTLEINGIYGGFEGEGTKTVIPAEAHAKITCRLVPNQDPQKILDLLEKHIAAHTPTGAHVTVQRMDTGNPYVTAFDHPAIQLAAEAYTHAYGVRAVFTRMGGSIPIVETFDRLLGLPAVLIGFGLDTENFHAPNEHFHLDNFDKGLRTLCYYWKALPKAMEAS
ncbi:dipeptidase [Alicyclobacillus cycloheptanicus]|jgi:acetylornithine deacetylase/succinyl-diaminopimelate desuccinylase-like protein|uniref:Acetylornithine deacetylase/succinyl-diaminopimelate desuccinylase-like protein n=1 Tax=Alicyclobacillus cycloheptanicus TaxID=1457 RepID=A0ABT9XHE5_9BACL|nr:dipeptidase [Alicyclobacillus cycloheptanicus]MDQ0189705.1 acetylornithine deacetylase/succinyl-diaminopimelate desuccinylase-like protein [Alicyclobacillus cycloheptanicus]WDM01917.1 dipeptidase [Alicyclobacillus cycloheptanicus]